MGGDHRPAVWAEILTKYAGLSSNITRGEGMRSMGDIRPTPMSLYFPSGERLLSSRTFLSPKRFTLRRIWSKVTDSGRSGNTGRRPAAPSGTIATARETQYRRREAQAETDGPPVFRVSSSAFQNP